MPEALPVRKSGNFSFQRVLCISPFLCIFRTFQPRVTKALPQVRLIDDYSTWEGLDTTYNGKPNPRVTVYCVDPETGRPVLRGTPGEIRVGGDTISQGYMGDDEKTKKKFVSNTVPLADHEEISTYFRSSMPLPLMEAAQVTAARAFGCTPSKACRVDISVSSSSASCSKVGHDYRRPELVYLTGDRGEITKDGRLRIYGRADDTVKIRGFKVPLPMVSSFFASCFFVSLVLPLFLLLSSLLFSSSLSHSHQTG